MTDLYVNVVNLELWESGQPCSTEHATPPYCSNIVISIDNLQSLGD